MNTQVQIELSQKEKNARILLWAILEAFAIGSLIYMAIDGNVMKVLMSIFDSLVWLSENLAFTFVIGFFYGVFIVDVVYSTHLIAKIKAYAKENEIIVKWEKLKSDIRSKADKLGEKTPFLLPLKFHRLITERREKEKNKKENLDSNKENTQ